jgi:hypothetical protein
MAETQAEADDALRIAARRVLRAARARPASKRRSRRAWWGGLTLLLALVVVTVSLVVFAQQL